MWTRKHARLLAKRGFQIYGIEKPKNDRHGTRKQQTLTIKFLSFRRIFCQQGDALSTSVGTCCDVALSLFHVLSYQTEDSQIIALLQNVNRHLNIGGFLILDFSYSHAVHEIVPETRVKRVSNEITL